jgi:hypothetical protein
VTDLRPDPRKPGEDKFAPDDVNTEVPDEPVPDDVTEDTEETPPEDED